MTRTLTLTLVPHIERSGCHTERFEAYLGDQLVAVTRAPLLDGARALLDLGCSPETLLATRHASDNHLAIKPTTPIGELAKWTITDESRDGLRWRRWRDPDMASPTRAEPQEAIDLPPAGATPSEAA